MSRNIIDRILRIKPWKLFLILLAFRLPYLIAYYPGTMIYDTGSSIAQFFGLKTHVVSISTNPDAILSNHHMILLTFLMGGAVKLGGLLGSQNFGFFLYTLTQVLITNAVVVYGLCVMRQKSHRVAYLISVIVYAVLPIFSLWQITVSKDSLFSAFALLLIILLYRLMESNGAILRRKKYQILLLITNLMVILSKPQGVYISLLAFIIIALVFRKYWIKLICIGIIPPVLYMTVFTGIVLPAMNVAVSGKQEMLGFSFQQTARYVCEHGDEVTPEQKEAINAILPYEDLAELYDPISQDPVKFCYKQDATGEDLLNYLKTWLGLLIKHPGTCITATLENIQHFFIPDADHPFACFPVLLENSAILIDAGDVFTLHNTKPHPVYQIVAAANDLLASNPVTMIFFQPCFYVWITIIGSIILLIQKKFRILISMTPLILSMLILVIAPVVDIRYVLQAVYFMPMFPMLISQRKAD